MQKKLIILSVSLFNFTTAVQADSGHLVNPDNGHAYQRFDSNKTWANAKAACAATDGYLATVTSKAENDWIVSNKLHTGNPWLGGTDEGKEGIWAWITGEVWSYTNWDSSQPDNHNNEDYLQFYGGGGKWNDGWYDPSVGFPYLCEYNLPTDKTSPPIGIKASGFTGSIATTCQNTTTGQSVQFNKKSNQFLDCKAAGLVVNSGDKVSVNAVGKTAPFASHQYELNTNCGGWFACKIVAESLGGHLATITTKEEQAFVYSQFKVAGNFWIGLSDFIKEGTFQWVTAEPLTYTIWNIGQPDNKGGAEDCAVIDSTGKWSDMNCDITLPAVIEYE